MIKGLVGSFELRKWSRACVWLWISLERVWIVLGYLGSDMPLSCDDAGALVFEPSTVTISKGDSVTWTNNAGFPHNIVFDEDAVPAGVNADALSNEDYLNAPGETVTRKFDVAGEYGYYCEPHQGAGMVGKVIVQ